MGKYALQTAKLTCSWRVKLLLCNSSALYFNTPIGVIGSNYRK